MKVILLDVRTGSDWSLDLLFSGLVYTLGASNVYDLPVHEKHRQGIVGLTGNHERDWGNERKSLGYTPYYPYLPRGGISEMYHLAKKGEISYIFVDERDESCMLYRNLQLHMFDIPVVVVSGHDRFWNDSVEKVKALYGKRFHSMFADNMLPEIYKHDRVYPYRWSANFDHLWDAKRDSELLKEKAYDICFMGYNSHGSRARYVDHIAKRWGHLNNHIVLETQANTFNAFVPKREYFRKIAQSKIAINFRGAAVNGKAMRFLEIPYVGSCMLSEKTGWILEDDWEDWKQLVYFRNESDLDHAVDTLLGDADLRERIASAGKRNLFDNHLASIRAKEIIGVLNANPRR